MEALSYCQLMERCLAAEARVVELTTENVAIREQSEEVYAAGYNHGHLNTVDGIAYTDCVKDEFYDLALQVMAEVETTATNVVLNELRNEAGARAVELFAKTLGSPYTFRDEKCYEDGFTRAIEIVRDTHAPRFAQQLRECTK